MRGNTERIAALLAPAIRAIHTPEAVRRAKRVEAAIADDGSLSDYAANSSLGHGVATWYISGTIATGNQQGMIFRVPADGRITRFDLNIKTAPTGADLKVRLRRNNIVMTTATIPASSTSGGFAVNLAINAGNTLTIDVTQVGSSVAGSNLTISVTYREER